MPYGVSLELWERLPAEDRAAVKGGYETAPAPAPLPAWPVPPPLPSGPIVALGVQPPAPHPVPDGDANPAPAGPQPPAPAPPAAPPPPASSPPAPSSGLTNEAFDRLPHEDQVAICVTAIWSGTVAQLPSHAQALAATPEVQQLAATLPPESGGYPPDVPPPPSAEPVEPGESYDIGDDPEAGPEPTADELLRWELNAEAYEQGLPLFFAVSSNPGDLIGWPYEGSHSKQVNCQPPPGPSCNWQSMNAVDVWLWPGTAVTAVADGTVSPGSWGWGESQKGGRFAGWRVHLVTGDGKVFFYTHMSGLEVGRGQPVRAGQLLGRSGIANGVPHLHFAARPPFDPRGFYKAAFSLKDRNPIVPNPAAPAPPPDDGLVDVPGDGGVQTAWHQLMVALGQTWPAASSHIRDARKQLDDAVT